MKNACPNHDILTRFVAARLTDAEADETVAHLETCAACQQFVDETERNSKDGMLVSFGRLQDGTDWENHINSPLPKIIGQYEILQKTGQGGMGVVYKAMHQHLKREVALKVISDSRLDDPGSRERFVQEMLALGKLTHPNIILATDAGIDGNIPYIVTEILDGQDLGSYIQEHGKMAVKQAVDCVRQAATGLAYAHKAGYIHRDIKPSNLFLTRDGVVKILDLGIARSTDSSTTTGQTLTGHVVGSPDFMAPEQFRGGVVSTRSDIYSLGQTFAYLITGTIHSDSIYGVPSWTKEILARMTAGVPSQRFHTVDDLINDLDQAPKDARFNFWAWLIFFFIVIFFVVYAIFGVVNMVMTTYREWIGIAY